MVRIKLLRLLLVLFLLVACTPVNSSIKTAVAGTLNAPPPAAVTALSTHEPSLTCSNTPTMLTPLPSETPTASPIGPLQVYFVDVGQGDAELILAPDGGIVLIDGGEPDSGILPFLQDHSLTHIDLIVATHAHSDHIGGLVQVLDRMPVTRVFTNGQLDTTAIFERFLDAVAKDKAAFSIVKRGDTITQGLLSFTVLSPVDTRGTDLNNNSLVLRLVYGQVSFLFMGDADQAAEAGMIHAGLAVPTTILKVGHHGSETASSPAFLAKIKPAVAIYSAGMGNPYGHPKVITLQDLAAVGAQVYGTDVNGTVLVTTDGGSYQVTSAKGELVTAPPVLLSIITP